MSFPKWPYYSEDEIEIVSNILREGTVNYWTGETTNLFEKEFSHFCGCKYNIALANGSLALSCAYLAIGLTNGDEIITTPRSFVATASSAMLLGGKPVFADVDKNSGNITAESIEPLINENTKAIVVVHIGGWPAEMVRIANLAKKYNLFLIEDCAQAHGAAINIKNKFISVGQFGDISTWSFCQDKIISTGGEGGMISTNNEEFYKKIWAFKDHGKSLDKIFNKSKSVSYRYVHDNLGSNFRITNIQSGIGLIQLKKIEYWNKIRTRNAQILINELSDIEFLRVPIPGLDIRHAWYKFTCYIEEEKLKEGLTRDVLIKKIREKGFPAFQGSCSELYLENCFNNKKNTHQILPIAKKLGETSLCFLIHPTISEDIMSEYTNAIRQVILEATK